MVKHLRWRISKNLSSRMRCSNSLLLCWSGIQMLDVGPGPALQDFVPQGIRGDKLGD
jgi:hypothetical protein